MENHIQNVINRPSKDQEFGEALEQFVALLLDLDIPYITLGSTSIQSYLPRFIRVPNDFDISLPEEKFESIRSFAIGNKDFRYEHNEVAPKLFFCEKYHMHLIPEKMNYIDRKTNTIFAKVPIYFIDRIETRPINLVNFKQPIRVTVPILEYAFILNLFAPLDSNSFFVAVTILEMFELNEEFAKEFLQRLPVMQPILTKRFERFREMLAEVKPELVGKLPPSIITF